MMSQAFGLNKGFDDKTRDLPGTCTILQIVDKRRTYSPNNGLMFEKYSYLAEM